MLLEIVPHILLRIDMKKSDCAIVLRELKEKDAPLMLEWMHDPVFQRSFKKRMLDTTREDVLGFIASANIPEKVVTGVSLHYAIVDSADQYLGTISLKDIDIENGTSEYAIIVRKVAQGKGIAFEATQLILKKAFQELGLRRVFLSVHSDNTSAIKLYEKAGFRYEGEFREHFVIDGRLVGWKWYGMLKDEYYRQINV